MRILVTAGPTHEYWDAVRFVGNASSGRMGIAVAAAAAARGHRVTLVLGPTREPPPAGVRVVRVTSAREMAAAARRAAAGAEAVVMTAAVADYRPARRIRGKLRRRHGRFVLELVANPDILAALGRRKGRRVHVGFALEPGAGLRSARAKLARKNLDAIVIDHPAAIGADRATVTWLDRSGGIESWRNITKKRFGRLLCDRVEALAAVASRQSAGGRRQSAGRERPSRS